MSTKTNGIIKILTSMEGWFMKKVILILVILLLTSCYKKRIEDISKQEIRDGIVYAVNEDKPYSGVFIEK